MGGKEGGGVMIPAQKVEAGLLRAAQAFRTGPAQRGAGVMGMSDGFRA